MADLIIPLSKPSITSEDISEVVRVLESGMLVQGKEVLELETVVSDYLGIDYCCAVSSGTAGLHLALLALNIQPGDEVIVPAFSFVATANVIELIGATCVFVDIDLRYFNLDESKIRAVISNKTRAIVVVHEFGLCANMPAIMKIAKECNLKVIEDAACALGAKIDNKFAGTFGDIGSFSLHPRKTITSGEGGLLSTNNSELDLSMRRLRNHGIEPNSSPMNFTVAGLNYRLTDFQAAFVKSQFNRFQRTLLYKSELSDIYIEEIVNEIVLLPLVPDNCTHTWQTFHVLLESELMRDQLADHLKEHGIFTNYGAQCIPHMTYYEEKYNHNSIAEFPNSYKAFTCGLAIPLYEGLSKNDVKFISKTINKFKSSVNK